MHLADLETDNFSSLPPSVPSQPPPSYARMYTAEQGTQVAGASRSVARPSASVPSRNPTLLARIFLASYRPRRPVFSNLLVQPFAQFPFYGQSFCLLPPRNLHLKNGGCIAMRISSLGRGVQCTFSPVSELPALMHPPCISA